MAEGSAVEAWLGDLGLEDYVDNFVANGYDDLEALK